MLSNHHGCLKQSERLSFHYVWISLLLSAECSLPYKHSHTHAFHVRSSAPFISICFVSIHVLPLLLRKVTFIEGYRWWRMWRKMLRAKQRTSIIINAHASHSLCNFRLPNCWLTRTKMHCDVTHSQSVRVITFYTQWKQLTGSWPDGRLNGTACMGRQTSKRPNKIISMCLIVWARYELNQN